MSRSRYMCNRDEHHVLIFAQSIPHPSTFSNVFSETKEQIKVKYHVEPPWDGRTKVCSNDLGHMTKMATMPMHYMVFRIDRPGCGWNLEYSIGQASTTKFVQRWPLVDHWPFYTKVNFGFLTIYLYGKTFKGWMIQKYWSLWYKILIYIDVYIKLNEYKEMYMPLRSRLFFDLWPRPLRFQ